MHSPIEQLLRWETQFYKNFKYFIFDSLIASLPQKSYVNFGLKMFIINKLILYYVFIRKFNGGKH